MKIIMYHYVLEYNNEFPYFNFLHINNFKKQLDEFKKKYYFPTREEFIKFTKNKIKLPSNSVILTFDDGLKCHYEYVLPELVKRNLWGIFFISCSPYINNDILDVHKIHLLLGRFNSKIIFDELQDIIKKKKLFFDKDFEAKYNSMLYSNHTYNNNYVLIIKKILNYYIKNKYKSEIIDKLFSKYFPNYKKYVNNFYLSESDIKKMYNLGMIIGNHTLNHHILSSLSYNEQLIEIEKNYEFIEKIIGLKDIRYFAYPYGGKYVYNKDTIDILKKTNTLCAFDTNSEDLLLIDKNNIYKLPRYDCNLFENGQIFNTKNINVKHSIKELDFKTNYRKKYSCITIFTSNHPRHLYLVKLLSTISDKVYAIIECTTLYKKRENYLKKYFEYVKKAENKIFNNISFLPKNVEVLSLAYNDLSKLNLEIFQKNFDESEVFIVFGASWIKGDLCKKLEKNNAINIHLGLSPYYRGSGTNFWALYDYNIKYVGATIHKLALKLDAGDIIYNTLPIFKIIKNPFNFTMNIVKITHEILIEKLLSRDIWRIKWKKQNKNLEIRYSKNNDFNEEIAKKFLNNLDDFIIKNNKNNNEPAYFNPVLK